VKTSIATRVASGALAAAAVTAALLVPLGGCTSSAEPAGPASDGGTQDAVVSDALPDAAAAEASAAPSFNADPQDVDAGVGDPSLDIAGSWIFFDAGQPWVRAEFYGGWPPPSTLYSWSCQVFLSTENAPVATYTVQSLSGTQTDYAEGIDKAKITFAVEPKGFRVLFADATLSFDRYALTCTSKLTSTSPLAQDDSGSFTVGTRETRTFGP
jgi:hypothetical protein